jgi:hypothetical protein
MIDTWLETRTKLNIVFNEVIESEMKLYGVFEMLSMFCPVLSIYQSRPAIAASS